ncbi:flagellar modification protein B [Parazoarcus communis]|uniref:Flagellar modification protein B n=1 Tax=Parazoarcus communis TaxID=41977 RepID=A0A2U8GUV7_9RHOO|nr:acylneuraminate cytidylyltransferase family protein [Parazoarcus communis]AWI77214.1 flagellar modification protein B [Parazoarcus communis]AWI79968.1 flagellar modification protein B [Parazoarcus communis]
MKRLCTICARGGSKGVKGKNLKVLLGKPLIAHSIDQARASGLFDLIAVSSDSDEILAVAQDCGADLLVKRPDELATDQAAKLPVIRHCVAEVERLTGDSFETLVDLDATSPLRTPEDIRDAVELLERSGAGNVITAMPARRSPYFNLVELDQDGIVHLSKSPRNAIVRRQDAPKCYDMNASIYVWRRAALFGNESLFNPDTRLHVMPEERSIDIDSELDFRFVEFLMASGVNVVER